MAEQGSAQGQSAPEQGPPSDRARLEEVYRFAQGQSAADEPKKETPVQSFWSRLFKGNEGQSRTKEVGRSVMRGLANVGNNVVRTAAEAGAAVADAIGVGGTEDEQDKRRQRAKNAQVVSEEEMNLTYGPRSDDIVASMTESLTQAAASMVLLRGAGMGNVAAGAVTDAVAFNPYEASLSEILAQHGDKVPGAGSILRALGTAGSVDADDSFVESRLKRVAEGGIAGAIFSGAIETVKATRKLARGRVAGDAVAVKEAEKTLTEIQDGNFTPADARVVARPNDDGTWRVEDIPQPAAKDVPVPQDEYLGVQMQGAPGTQVHDIGDGGKLVVARGEDGKAVGYAQLQQQPGRDGYEVLDILVDPAQRRKGVGSSILKAAKADGLDLEVTGLTPVSKEGDKFFSSRSDMVSRETAGPKFTRTEAEVQARTMDYALKMKDAPKGAKFSDADVQAHFETAEKIKNAESIDDAIEIVGSEDHFNLGAIASGEDFNAQMRGLIARYQDAFSTAKKRPVVPQDETIKAAASFARTLGIEDWAARVAGSADKMALSVETVLKVSAVRQVGDRLAEISALRAARPHDPALLDEAKRLLNVWHGISLEAFEHRSELGRSLNILGALKEGKGADVKFGKSKGKAADAAQAGRQEKSPASGLADDMSPEMLDLTLRLFARSGGEPRNMHAVLKAMDAAMRQVATKEAGKTGMAKIADWVTTVYINSLISGAKTAQSIFQSGMAMNALEATSRMLAGTATANRALVQEGAAYWYAMFRYGKENIKSAAAAFSEGTSVLEGSPAMYVKSGITGTAVTIPGRVAGSIDEFTRATAYRAEEFAKALRAAQAEGLSWSDAVKRAESDVSFSVDSQTGIAMNPVALERANIPTLSSPLGADTFMGKVSNAIAESPWGKLIIPFMRPSVNTFRYVWQNTPGLNLFNKQARETIMAGGEDAAVLHTRSVIAGSMMVYAYTKFSQGEMTGTGPSDPALRKVWLQSHQPYSLRVGDDWVSYRRMEPFASWLGMVADAAEATHEIDSDGDRQSVMGATFAALMKNSYNKSWTQGLAQFLDAWDVKDKNAIGRWGKGLVSGFVPYALSQFNDDPVMREARSVVDAVRAKIPGLSTDLPAKYNLVGEPVMKQGSLWNRNFSTTPVKSAKGQLLEDTLLENGIGMLPFPSKLAKGQIDLLDPRWEKNGKLPYIRFMEILKENDLRGELEAEIKSESFQRASGGTPTFPGGQREAVLKAIKDRAEQKALNQMLREFDPNNTGLRRAYQGAQYVLPTRARYKGPEAEAAAREKYGIPALR